MTRRLESSERHPFLCTHSSPRPVNPSSLRRRATNPPDGTPPPPRAVARRIWKTPPTFPARPTRASTRKKHPSRRAPARTPISSNPIPRVSTGYHPERTPKVLRSPDEEPKKQKASSVQSSLARVQSSVGRSSRSRRRRSRLLIAFPTRTNQVQRHPRRRARPRDAPGVPRNLRRHQNHRQIRPLPFARRFDASHSNRRHVLLFLFRRPRRRSSSTRHRRRRRRRNRRRRPRATASSSSSERRRRRQHRRAHESAGHVVGSDERGRSAG